MINIQNETRRKLHNVSSTGIFPELSSHLLGLIISILCVSKWVFHVLSISWIRKRSHGCIKWVTFGEKYIISVRIIYVSSLNYTVSPWPQQLLTNKLRRIECGWKRSDYTDIWEPLHHICYIHTVFGTCRYATPSTSSGTVRIRK